MGDGLRLLIVVEVEDGVEGCFGVLENEFLNMFMLIFFVGVEGKERKEKSERRKEKEGKKTPH
jgi:hypothetical protein